MRTAVLVGLFLCVAAAQIVTPLSMIAKRESVLKNGVQFSFKTAPVDPFDAFRGRYVALRIESEFVPRQENPGLSVGQTVYAVLANDDQGFAKIIAAVTNKPVDKPCIQAKVIYITGDKVQLDLQIDRYYMEEKAAPAAEKIHLRHSQRKNQDAYITVRVKDGLAVVENLMVGGKRIEDAVKESAGSKE